MPIPRKEGYYPSQKHLLQHRECYTTALDMALKSTKASETTIELKTGSINEYLESQGINPSEYEHGDELDSFMMECYTTALDMALKSTKASETTIELKTGSINEYLESQGINPSEYEHGDELDSFMMWVLKCQYELALNLKSIQEDLDILITAVNSTLVQLPVVEKDEIVAYFKSLQYRQKSSYLKAVFQASELELAGIKRKRVSLSKRAKQILEEWWEMNREYPYATKDVLQDLSRKTGLQILQIKTFILSFLLVLYLETVSTSVTEGRGLFPESYSKDRIRKAVIRRSKSRLQRKKIHELSVPFDRSRQCQSAMSDRPIVSRAKHASDSILRVFQETISIGNDINTDSSPVGQSRELFSGVVDSPVFVSDHFQTIDETNPIDIKCDISSHEESYDKSPDAELQSQLISHESLYSDQILRCQDDFQDDVDFHSERCANLDEIPHLADDILSEIPDMPLSHPSNAVLFKDVAIRDRVIMSSRQDGLLELEGY
ncbi:hypothetical protein ADUPG1_013461 [Aduncisulcus paluster]|uniref:Uncharacterized protein n=1 Tax=Aduncisulcus paluster TaxID=2918883 RepID=A0ABQ5K311_9EUKA|nr:hypothetical protein ADUPG1_013461 [Aduncisulcus paluster]